MLGKNRAAFAEIPDRAVLTLTRQEKEKRSIMHLLFAHTTLRGEHTEIIEDTVPLYNVKCSVKCDKKPSSISIVPCEKELEFEYADGFAKFVVPEVNIHQMIAIKD